MGSIPDLVGKVFGCLTGSAGEYAIEKILSNNHIPYIKQYHTEECRFPDT